MGKADQDDEMYVELELENGTVDCAIVTIFENNGRDYIALLPLDDNGENEEGEVWIYRHNEDEEGNPSLEYIEDEAEYESAADAFDEYLEKQEFDELTEDDEDSDEE